MKSVGIRELQRDMLRIIQEVDELGEEVEVTRHGRTVARLLPPSKYDTPEEIEARLKRLHDLIDQIAALPEGEVPVDTPQSEDRRW